MKILGNDSRPQFEYKCMLFGTEKQSFVSMDRDIWRYVSSQLLEKNLGEFCLFIIKANIRQDCTQCLLFSLHSRKGKL